MAWKWTPSFGAKLESGYRSKFEERIAKQLDDEGIAFDYETEKFGYVVPARNATYTPDFFLPNGIIIEGKGRFKTAAERQKLILVKEAHPELDIRLLFQNANLPIYKGSPTTYAKWAETHGFPWADKRIPEDWIKEAKRTRRLQSHSR
jgi:hypothetical protein